MSNKKLSLFNQHIINLLIVFKKNKMLYLVINVGYDIGNIAEKNSAMIANIISNLHKSLEFFFFLHLYILFNEFIN